MQGVRLGLPSSSTNQSSSLSDCGGLIFAVCCTPLSCGFLKFSSNIIFVLSSPDLNSVLKVRYFSSSTWTCSLGAKDDSSGTVRVHWYEMATFAFKKFDDISIIMSLPGGLKTALRGKESKSVNHTCVSACDESTG